MSKKSLFDEIAESKEQTYERICRATVKAHQPADYHWICLDEVRLVIENMSLSAQRKEARIKGILQAKRDFTHECTYAEMNYTKRTWAGVVVTHCHEYVAWADRRRAANE